MRNPFRNFIVAITLCLFSILFVCSPCHATYNLANYCYGTLTSSIGSGTTTFTVSPGSHSGTFPASNFLLTIISAPCSVPDNCPHREIILISTQSGGTFTISTRNMEGTSFVGTWPIGSKVGLVTTAGILSQTILASVPTVFGRTGDVVAQSDDYSAFYEVPLIFSSPLSRTVDTISLTRGDLTSSDIAVTNGTSAVTNSGTFLSIIKGALTETTSSVLTIAGGSNAVLGSGTTLQVKKATGGQSGYLDSADFVAFSAKENSLTFNTPLSRAINTVSCSIASGSQAGCLSSASWTVFNNKQTALNFGDLVEITSNVLTISGGTGSVIGSGVTVQAKQAATGQSGYLSSTDWNTFNGKQNASLTTDYTFVGNSSGIPVGKALPTGGTDGCSGAGDKVLYNSATHLFECGVDQTTPGGTGILSLNSLTTTSQAFGIGTSGSDFNISSATATHTFNLPDASASTRGALSSTDWSIFNGKLDTNGSGTSLTALNASNMGSGVVSITYGGTGTTTATTAFNALSPMTTLGDIIYGGTSGTRTRLAGNTTSTRKFLVQVGTGAVSAPPIWDIATTADIGLPNVENTTLSTWPGTVNIITIGTVTSGVWNATTLAVNKGGTNQTSYYDGQLLIGNTATEGLNKSTLTAGDGISITNGNGTISIAAIVGSGLSSNALSSDVTMTTAGTYYTGPSISLVAGTYLIIGTVTIHKVASAYNATCKLWDGSTTFASTSVGGASISTPFTLALSSSAVLSTTSTVEISCVSSVGTTLIKATTPYLSATSASKINALKIQ